LALVSLVLLALLVLALLVLALGFLVLALVFLALLVLAMVSLVPDLVLQEPGALVLTEDVVDISPALVTIKVLVLIVLWLPASEIRHGST
jgi:hypothetical protein